MGDDPGAGLMIDTEVDDSTEVDRGDSDVEPRVTCPVTSVL
jgi:hypothetical protein